MNLTSFIPTFPSTLFCSLRMCLPSSPACFALSGQSRSMSLKWIFWLVGVLAQCILYLGHRFIQQVLAELPALCQTFLGHTGEETQQGPLLSLPVYSNRMINISMKVRGQDGRAWGCSAVGRSSLTYAKRGVYPQHHIKDDVGTHL